MTTVPAIVERLQRLGVVMAVIPEGRLNVDGDESVLTDALLAEIKAAKVEIIGYLRERDAKLTTETLDRLRRGHAWLTANVERHMAAGPGGDPEWLAALDKWLAGEAVLRTAFGWTGCIYETGVCPDRAPLCCDDCARSGRWQAR